MERSLRPSFTKERYELVASVLHSTMPGFSASAALTPPVNDKMAQWERTCLAFLNRFHADNKSFNRAKFLAACKGESK